MGMEGLAGSDGGLDEARMKVSLEEESVSFSIYNHSLRVGTETEMQKCDGCDGTFLCLFNEEFN